MERRLRGRTHPLLLVLVVIVIVGMLAFFALAWHPAIATVAPPAPASFDRALVRRGEQLALLGDCTSCHSTHTGAAYAGGVGVQTDFGTIYSTNITPDPATGIGAWSQQAFTRALREGVSRDGHLLYPAFPYNHFTHLADPDIAALYAFFMTRTPAQARAPHNQLRFPLQFRPLVAGWNLLYLKRGPVAQDTARGAEWNRGAYLMQSAGHCAACHAPHTRLGGERTALGLAGGTAEDWYASALNTNTPSPVPWTPETLATYLRTGLVPEHAITAGPMQEVVHNLAQVDPADVRAIAAYIHSGMGPVTEQQHNREASARQKAALPSLALVQTKAAGPAPDAQTLQLGATVYQSVCASCHDAGRQIASDGAMRLPLGSALYQPVPDNLIHIIRQGIAPPLGERGRWMPASQGTLSDDQLTALVTWLRRQGTDEPPWNDVAKAVQQDRSMQ
ncbi:MAG: c-type cytochrome [Burkholderiales bacterium]